MITLKEAAKLILSKDNIEILSHRSPDGDTLGCSCGLAVALQSIGKNVKISVSGGIPKKFEYLYDFVKKQDFESEFIISVDIAAPSLLGDLQSEYENRIDLCIDHHSSNRIECESKLVDSTAAAACEIVYDIIKLMNVEITDEIATCIYTGISTDTGCFRFSNTTPKTHRIAAEVMQFNCGWFDINQKMFEIKTRSKVRLERMVYDTMEFFAQGKCAVIYTTLKMQEELKLDDDELEGLASIPRQIEGVLLGITMKEKSDGTVRVSVRTNGDVDAAKFCGKFGGGGHKAAAGCSISADLQTAKQMLVKAAEEFL